MWIAIENTMKTEENKMLSFFYRVSHCKLSPDDCKIFGSVLMSSKTLKVLNLAYNNLNQGISLLCKALCHPDCILEYLV
jgi:hypothetical protein